MGLTLLIGGARSGKSRYAESLIEASGAPVVRYCATGALNPADPAWSGRIAAHQARRPAHWETVVSQDVAVLCAPLHSTPTPTNSSTDSAPQQSSPVGTALLLDDLPSWVTAQLTELTDWETCSDTQRDLLLKRASAFLHQLRHLANLGTEVVVVTQEVGWGVAPATAAGNIFRDIVGQVNELWARQADTVTLVVAGLPFSLTPGSAPPRLS